MNTATTLDITAAAMIISGIFSLSKFLRKNESAVARATSEQSASRK
jgi:hypothetical protein